MSLPPPEEVQEPPDAAACQSEGGARLSVLRAVRQGVPPDVLECAYVAVGQRRRTGGGRPDVRGHRGVRAGPVAGRTGERTERQDVPSPTRCGGCSSRSRMASNGRWGSRRSGTAWCRWRRCWSWSRSSRPTWSRSNTPTGPNRSALDAVQAGPRAAQRGAYGGGRRRLERVLRQHPARRTDEVGRPPDQRSAPAGADQDVAGGAGRGDRRAGAACTGRRATRTRAGAARKGRRSPRCWPTSTCVGSSWAGRQLGHERAVSRPTIVNYADDFVICCRGTADEAMAVDAGHDVAG